MSAVSDPTLEDLVLDCLAGVTELPVEVLRGLDGRSFESAGIDSVALLSAMLALEERFGGDLSTIVADIVVPQTMDELVGLAARIAATAPRT
jgi:acyl carrier protein